MYLQEPFHQQDRVEEPSCVTEHVRPTCKLQRKGEPSINVLGIELEGGAVQTQPLKHVENLCQLCATLSGLEDIKAELSLLRVSANASKIAHLLRAAGPCLPKETLRGFDQMQREVLGDTLGAKMSNRMWRQATTPASA